MFRVLTHRPKSRLTSPKFIAASVVAHLWLAFAVATVSRADTPPDVVPDSALVWDIDPPAPPTPPPPASVQQPAKRPPAAAPNVQLRAPTSVPPRIVPEPPSTEPQPVDTGLGDGGEVIGTPSPAVKDPAPNGPTVGGTGWVYDPDMVEVRPSLDNQAETARLLRRYYPALYADAGVAGRTVVELVVEPNGRVRAGSVRVVETSHEEFASAALRVAERLHFRPARIADQSVAVVVQIPIDWRVDD